MKKLDRAQWVWPGPNDEPQDTCPQESPFVMDCACEYIDEHPGEHRCCCGRTWT